MITDLAKLTTGLVVRAGIGPPLRTAAFAAMALVAWWLAPPVLAWAAELEPGGYPEGIVAGLLVLAPIVGALIAGLSAIEGDYSYTGGCARRPWSLADFLRRAPFTAWCLITDDGRYMPLDKGGRGRGR